MSSGQADQDPSRAASPWTRLGEVFDLSEDQAPAAEIDASIRAGAYFHGTHLWILICAIFMASIGLNVNSAAVIIGAMLISPLMGPIIGVGYGAGVNDFRLIRTSLRNLAVAVVLSLLTSTVYFLLTPLAEPRSEILARTTPAIWDVLIALFGGVAGIIGITRREKGTVIPGVAIATALMPPLCTAGFGIATLQPQYALGALYLFTINSVFIATAALILVRVMRLPEVTTIDPAVRARTRWYIGAIVLGTAVPSVVLAYGMVRRQAFESRAEHFIDTAFSSERGTFVVAREIEPPVVRVTVVGETISDAAKAELHASLATFGLSGVDLQIHQVGHDEVDLASLRAQVGADLQRDTLVVLDEKTMRIRNLEQELERVAEAKAEHQRIGGELRAMFPQVTGVSIGVGTTWDGDAAGQDTLMVTTTSARPLPEAERERIEAWLKVRARIDHVWLSTGR